jgi:hypothetical protein
MAPTPLRLWKSDTELGVELREYRDGVALNSNTVRRICICLSGIYSNEPLARVSLAEAPHRRQGSPCADFHSTGFDTDEILAARRSRCFS